MQVRARLRPLLQDLWQTSVISFVLLVLFNSAVWAPALEASPFGAFSSTSADAAPATPSASHPPDTPPASAVDRKVLLTEPKDAPAPSTALVPAEIDAGSAKKSPDLPQPSLQAMSQKLSAQRPVFIENKGQFDARVRFQVHSGAKTLWLTDNGIVFDFVKGDPSTEASSGASTHRVRERAPGQPPAA